MSDFYKNKKVVVTGGSGMIGTHMIHQLLDEGAIVKTSVHKSPIQITSDIFAKFKFVGGLNFKELGENYTIVNDIDLTNIDDCIKLIDGADIVIHLAGMIANPKQVPTDFQITLNQITCLTNVVDASQRCGVKHFIDLNSGTGYPLREWPLREEEYWDDEPYISYYGYGWMRRYREKVLEHCSHISDMKIYITRASAVFGPHDNFDLETSHVIPSLIKRYFAGEDPFIVWGSPDVVRDFIYVKDVVKGMLLVIEKGEPMKPYNLGSGEELTIGQVVNTIVELTSAITGTNPQIRWDKNKPTTIPFKLANTDRIKKLNFKTDYSFYEAIRETVKWYKEECIDTDE